MFRLIPIHPDDQQLFCINWGDKIYIDIALQKACSSSCKIFQAVASTIAQISQYKLQIPTLKNLDDFMFGAANKVSLDDLQTFLSMCADTYVFKGNLSNRKYHDISWVWNRHFKQRKSILPEDKLQQCRVELDSLLYYILGKRPNWVCVCVCVCVHACACACACLCFHLFLSDDRSRSIKLKLGGEIEYTNILILLKLHNDDFHNKNVSKNKWHQWE